MIILDWRYFCRRYLFDAYDILKLSTLKLTKENQSLKKELDSFNHSISYKIGRIITYLPRLLLHRG